MMRRSDGTTPSRPLVDRTTLPVSSGRIMSFDARQVGIRKRTWNLRARQIDQLQGDFEEDSSDPCGCCRKRMDLRFGGQ